MGSATMDVGGGPRGQHERRQYLQRLAEAGGMELRGFNRAGRKILGARHPDPTNVKVSTLKGEPRA